MATPVICQTPEIVDLAFQPGDTVSFSVTLKDANSVPIDIAEYEFDAYIIYQNTKYDFTVTKTNTLLGETLVTMSENISINIPECSTWRFIAILPRLETFTYMIGNVKFQKL